MLKKSIKPLTESEDKKVSGTANETADKVKPITMDDMIFENIGWHTRLITNPSFILRNIGGQSIVVPVVSEGAFENTMLTLNDTASWLWSRFQKGAAPADVLEAARREFESENGDPEFITYGVYRFVLDGLNLKTLLPEVSDV